MTASARFGQMYAPLRVANYRTFLIGQTVSTVGSLIQATAQQWVVYELTRSPAALGTVAMLGSLPLVLLSPFAGSLADRADRRRLLIGTQLALAACAAILAILVQADVVEVWHLYVLATFTGAITALDGPALQAFSADLTGPALIRRTVALNMMGFQVSRMVGPTIAGLIVAYYGSATAFWVNAASFLAVIVALARVRFDEIGTSRPARAAQTSGGTAEAIRHVRANPILVNAYLYPLLYMLGASATTLYPAFVGDTLRHDARALGTIIGAWGAGTLATSLVVLPFVQNVKRAGMLSSALVAWFGLMLVLVRVIALPGPSEVISWVGDAVGLAAPMVAATAALTFLSGASGPIVLSTSTGLLQATAPPDMRARLSSLSQVFSFGSQPFVTLAVGLLGEVLGAPDALLVIGGGVCFLVFALVAVRPSMRAPVANHPPGGADPGIPLMGAAPGGRARAPDVIGHDGARLRGARQ